MVATKAASNVYCPSIQENLSRRRTRLYRPADVIRTRVSRSVRCDRATHQPQVMIQNPLLRVSRVPIKNKVRYDVFVPCSLESRDGIGCHVFKHAWFSRETQLLNGKGMHSFLPTTIMIALIRVFLRNRVRTRGATVLHELQRYHHGREATHRSFTLGGSKEASL